MAANEGITANQLSDEVLEVLKVQCLGQDLPIIDGQICFAEEDVVKAVETHMRNVARNP